MAFSVSEYKSVFSRVCILHPKKVVNVLIAVSYTHLTLPTNSRV